MLILSHSIPAIRDAGRAHKPMTIWNPPKVLALYSVGASSDTNVFWTGCNAPRCKPYKTNVKIIDK